MSCNLNLFEHPSETLHFACSLFHPMWNYEPVDWVGSHAVFCSADNSGPFPVLNRNVRLHIIAAGCDGGPLAGWRNYFLLFSSFLCTLSAVWRSVLPAFWSVFLICRQRWWASSSISFAAYSPMFSNPGLLSVSWPIWNVIYSSGFDLFYQVFAFSLGCPDLPGGFQIDPLGSWYISALPATDNMAGSLAIDSFLRPLHYVDWVPSFCC